MNTSTFKRASRAGFTLIELMAVILVMAILGSIIVGVSGYAGRRSAESKARAELQIIRNALEEYRVDRGTYPDQEFREEADWKAWLNDVNHPLTNIVADLNFLDPWGNAYQYEYKTRFSYELYSQGAPSREGQFFSRLE